MSIHSNDGKTWSTKLARVGELSRGSGSIVFNNVGHLIDLPYLLDCFRRLDGNRAIGTDGMTKEIYGGYLTANATELLISLRRGTYRPRPARLVEIPKEDGSSRPLAISCFEDKIIQLAVSRILEQIYQHELEKVGRNPCDSEFQETLQN